MTIKDIQQVSLEILKDVHQFCVENDICYTLFGGTMIGAIRHKGFIPWDDDVDIAMPRPHYERFLATYKSKKGYKLMAAGTEDSYLAFSRVCEMDKTRVVCQLNKWTRINTGCWIDIFPLDGSYDELPKEKMRSFMISIQWKICCSIRESLSDKAQYTEFNNTIKSRCKRWICKWLNIKSMIKRHIEMSKKICWGETNHFSNYSYMWYGLREYQETKDFNSVLLVPFEDSFFYVCNGYDNLMNKKYGDYMILPPFEKRKANHSYNHYYYL